MYQERYKIDILDNNIIPISVMFREPKGIGIHVVEFKMDTGATDSTINRNEIIKMGYDSSWAFRTGVVNSHGTVTASNIDVPIRTVRFPALNVGGIIFKNRPFFVKIDKGQEYPNLIGLDILSAFDITILNSQKVVYMERRTDCALPRVFSGGGEIAELTATLK